MTHLEINIQSLTDTPVKSEYDNAGTLILKAATVIEGLTANGRTGIVFMLEDEQGNKFRANMTARILNGLSAATKGAMERFGDNPDKA